MSRAEDLGLDIEYQDELRAEARERMKDVLWEEFHMTYSSTDIVKDMVESGEYTEDIVDALGDEYEEHRQMMFEEFCESRE